MDPPAPPDSPPHPAAPVVTARERFTCPACGGEAQWHPARQTLVCAYCGTESPATVDTQGGTAVVREHDLGAALRAIPDQARGWQAERTSVQCQSCRAISVFDPATISQRCEFCGSTALAPYQQVKEAFRPESVLPMRIAETEARDRIRAWYGRQWLAPNMFAGRALTDTVTGVYLPYWTFDAQAHAHWTAESGTYYWTRERGKQVRRVRWSPAAGDLSHVFDDDLVCASRGVDAGRLKAIEPFPTSGLVPYEARYLSGWTVEQYQIDLVAAAARSRQQMEAALRELCAREIPGDTYRSLVVHATFTGQTFKHILVPVWLLTYTYGSRTFQVVVNGVTGKIAGSRPWSWVKVALLVILAFVVLLFLLYLDS